MTRSADLVVEWSEGGASYDGAERRIEPDSGASLEVPSNA
jgi:hypothetical protein